MSNAEEQSGPREHCPEQGVLRKFSVGSLTPPLLDSVTRHVETCRWCLADLESYGTDGDELISMLGRKETAERLSDAEVTCVSRATPVECGPPPTATPPDASPTSTARYRVLRPHAKGGIGLVSVAQDGELNREVAFKTLQECHADNPHSRSRFLFEAEVTGGLEHRGIVPVYSLGFNAHGSPFYTMRFIKGVSLREAIKGCREGVRLRDLIERHERRDRLTGRAVLTAADLRELLRRFQDVCNVVAYAHDRGILHLDLKPANIMLGLYGETFVVDWGQAKRLDPPEPRTGPPPGTPGYRSPEQVAGWYDQLHPASDVYSLGATLYYVLTGRSPAESNELGGVSHRAQRSDFRPPRALDPSIDRALEAVCCKAMAVRPEDRYGSARALADDVERWMADEPVTAWHEPFYRRAGRWMRRYRTAVAVAVVVGVVGLGAVAVVQARAYQDLRQANHATKVALEESEEARRQAEAVGTFLVDAFRRPDPTQDGRQVKVADLLDQARAKLEHGFAGSQATKGALLDSLGRTYEGLGLYEQAVMILTLARDVRRAALGPEHFDTLRSCNNLANAYHDASRFPEAIALHKATLQLLEARLGHDHPETLKSRSNLAIVYADTGLLPEAIALHEEILRLREATLGPDHPDTFGIRGNLAVAYSSAGRIAEALALDEGTFKLMQAKLGPDHPDTLVIRNNLALRYRDAGRISEALDLDEVTLKMREAKLEPDHPDTLRSRNNLALDYWAAGRFPEAIALHEPTLKLMEAKLGPDHLDTLMSRANLAALFEAVGRQSEAIALQEASLNLMQSKLGADHPVTLASRQNLANAYRITGRQSEAIALLDATLKLMDAKLGPDHPYTLETRANLAKAYESVGRRSDAERLLRGVLARRRETVKSDSPLLASDLAQLGEILLNRENWTEAEPLLREALTIRERATPDNWEYYDAMSLLGAARMGRGGYAQAERPAVDGYEGMKAREARIPAPYRSRVLEAAMRMVQLYEAWNKPVEAAALRIKLGLHDLPADVFCHP